VARDARFLRAFGVAGAVLTFAAYPLWRDAWVVGILCLAQMSIVPLGVSLAFRDTHPRLARTLTIAIPLGAVSGVATWFCPLGAAAAACAAPWLVATSLIAIFALVRVKQRGLAPLPELALDVGLGLLPVGAVWLIASRAAIPLLGFHEPIVLLTAAHFHYAGFAAPVVLGATGRLLHPDATATSLVYRIGTVTVCLAVPLTALGIATDRALEAPAAVLLACGMLLSSFVVGVLGSRRALAQSKLAAALLAVSGATLLLTMTLAALFAVTGSASHVMTKVPLVSIARMIELHGAPNAVLFALAGLLGHVLLATHERT
jgi:hypothetical protein